jgi:septal ring factor EnvC (AmiA/AmiB activator)
LSPGPSRPVPVWLIALLFAAGQAGAQDDATRTRERLRALEQAIGELTREQRREEQRRGDLASRLREVEEAIGDISRERRANATAIGDTRARIDELAAQRRQLDGAARAQREAVQAEIRDAYQRGSRDQLRLLLSEDDPQQLARQLTYYRYVLGARRELLDEFRGTLRELDTVERQLAERETELAGREATLARQVRSLEETRGERQQVLAALDAELETQARQLAEQEAERARLEALLEEIEAAAARLAERNDVEAFSAARGRMPWPVEGPVTSAFGRPRAQGKLRWQGVRMRAEAGTPVQAVHHGRVVYADWLRGSGLLMVIDHGEGYMSLYAHNESLLREVGDWVSTGTAIATVGDTGGQSEAGLYFEIRKDGKPTDPSQWCRR